MQVSLRLIIKKENWFGVIIDEDIKIKNIMIKYGKSEVVIVFFNKLESADVIEYFAVLNYYLRKRDKIEIVFGLLISDSMKVLRKKLNNEVIESFSEEDMGRIFSGTNPEVFYSTTSELDHLLGIEIRYKEEISSWFKKEDEYLNVLREIGEQKEKIFKKKW